jgi:predicted amidohydrolase
VKADVVRVAVIQASPVFLDRDASLEKAVRLISEAARKGASLAAFGEGWVPGYPVHAWSLANSELWWELAAAYLEQAVDFQSAVIDANDSRLSLFDAVVHRSRGSNPRPASKIEARII